MTQAPAPGPSARATALAIAIIAIAALALVAVQWAGYIESDDLFYARAARGHLEHFPYLPIDHWGLRHLIVGPMALAFAVFGENEATLCFVTPMYLIALLILVFAGTAHVAGRRAGLIATAIAGTSPMLTVAAGYVTTDLPEAFFVTASLFAFLEGVRGGRARMFVLAGAAAALGLITRETTAALLVFYGVLFVAGYGGRRRDYLWIAAGFLPVALADWAWLWAVSGDPLYRVHIALRGVAGDGPQMAGRIGEHDNPLLPVPYLLRPVAMLFLHQSFGLFSWLALPLAAAGAWRLEPGGRRQAVRLMLLFALVWMGVNFYALSGFLWLIARYMLVLVPVLAIAAAIAVDALYPRRLPRLLVGGFAAAFAVTVLLAGMRDGELLFGERALVRFAETADRPVVTDSATLRGAWWLLLVRGIEGRVSAGAPRPGTVWFANAQPRRRNSDPPVVPGPGWTVLASYAAPAPVLIRVLRDTPVERLLPAPAARKLRAMPRQATAYLVPER